VLATDACDRAGLTVAPTVDAAYHATTNSMLLGAHNATTSPGCTP